MPYIPTTDRDRADMLQAIGVPDVEALFADVPESVRISGLNLPRGRSEGEVYEHLHQVSHRNVHHLTGFLGGG